MKLLTPDASAIIVAPAEKASMPMDAPALNAPVKADPTDATEPMLDAALAALDTPDRPSELVTAPAIGDIDACTIGRSTIFLNMPTTLSRRLTNRLLPLSIALMKASVRLSRMVLAVAFHAPAAFFASSFTAKPLPAAMMRFCDSIWIAMLLASSGVSAKARFCCNLERVAASMALFRRP